MFDVDWMGLLTRAVLRDHGYSDDEIGHLIAEGAAYDAAAEVQR